MIPLAIVKSITKIDSAQFKILIAKMDSISISIHNGNKEILINNILPSQEKELFGFIPESIARILIPAIVTILLFGLGITINWLIKKKDKRTNSLLIRDVVNIWIEQIKQPIILQAQGCRDLAHRLQASQDFATEKILINSLMVDKINDIKFEELITAFVRNVKKNHDANGKEQLDKLPAENLFKLLKAFQYLNLIEPKIKNQHELYIEETLKLIEAWNSALIKLNDIEVEMLQIFQNNKGHPSYSFIQSFLTHRQNWKGLGTSLTKQLTKTTLLTPIHSLVQHQLNLQANDPFAHRVGQIEFELSLTLKILEFQFASYKKNVLSIAISLVNTYKNLYKINLTLQKMNLKPLVYIK